MRVDGVSGDFNLFLDIETKIEKEPKAGFEDILKNFIADVNSELKSAGVAEEKLISGDVSNLEELMFQIQKADISFRLLTEVRNKALESYQDIMRMQV
ncbi:flagellar hook-basal body complex protein FliE [Nitrosophilus alvini]|uniref:flagellar hook-basal body complex protein FliE n=1 Tax=Nitrosophilus alvini TaxID=2714855 RepID=UPI00190A053A|nr:flagellar hook-basal body complex protein FliE [Nitrosophilus alvini]